MEPGEMRERVARARVARLATVDPSGRAAIVPCTFAVEFHALSGAVVYSAVDDKPKSTPELARLRNVEARPDAVALLVDEYDDDWSRLWWVRLRGAGRVLRSGPERERAVELLARKYSQYQDRRPAGAVLAIDVSEWKAWAARG